MAKQNGGRASLTFLGSAVLSGVRGDEGAQRQGYPKIRVLINIGDNRQGRHSIKN